MSNSFPAVVMQFPDGTAQACEGISEQKLAPYVRDTIEFAQQLLKSKSSEGLNTIETALVSLLVKGTAAIDSSLARAIKTSPFLRHSGGSGGVAFSINVLLGMLADHFESSGYGVVRFDIPLFRICSVVSKHEQDSAKTIGLAMVLASSSARTLH